MVIGKLLDAGYVIVSTGYNKMALWTKDGFVQNLRHALIGR